MVLGPDLILSLLSVFQFQPYQTSVSRSKGLSSCRPYLSLTPASSIFHLVNGHASFRSNVTFLEELFLPLPTPNYLCIIWLMLQATYEVGGVSDYPVSPKIWPMDDLRVKKQKQTNKKARSMKIVLGYWKRLCVGTRSLTHFKSAILGPGRGDTGNVAKVFLALSIQLRARTWEFRDHTDGTIAIFSAFIRGFFFVYFFNFCP